MKKIYCLVADRGRGGVVVLVKASSSGYDVYPVLPIKGGGGTVLVLKRGNWAIEACIANKPAVRGLRRLPAGVRPVTLVACMAVLKKVRADAETRKMRRSSIRLAKSLAGGKKKR